MAAKKTNLKKTKRVQSKRSKKVVPTQLILPQRLNSITDMVIPVDRNLSNMNHRLYQQGRIYNVKVGIPTSSGNSHKVFALVDTWFLRAAYRYARRTYNLAVKEELESLDSSQVAKWRDFRITSPLPINASRCATMANTAATLTDVPLGEYSLSEVEDTAGLMKRFGLSPDGPTTYNILTQYSRTFNESQSPSTVTVDSAYGDLPNMVKSFAQVEDLQEDGDMPPYDANGLMEGATWVQVGTLDNNVTGAKGISSTGYFPAPLGMVRIISASAPSDTGIAVTITVQKGDYKGVNASSI